jgi:hypothetical protein
MICPRYNIVPTVKTKFLQIRISEDIKADLQVVAELRGLSTSALIHSLIVKTVREEKNREPRAFQANAINRAGGVRVAPRAKQHIPLIKNSKTRREADNAPKTKNKVA